MNISIGIPVYNAIAYLPATVASVISEASQTKEEIDLVIVDNKSTDGTTDYLRGLENEYELPKNLKLRLFFNTVNEGLDFSTQKIIQESKGRYLWILGAQELLIPNSLNVVLGYLSTNPWQVVLNFEVFNEESNLVIWENSYNKFEDIVTENAEAFYEQIGGPSLSISANITRKSSLVEMIKNRTYSSYWGWLEYLFDVSIVPNRDGSFVFISSPILRVTIESDGWQNRNQRDTGFPMYFTSIELSEIALRKFKDIPRIKNTIGVFGNPFGCVPTILRAKRQGLKCDVKTLRRSTVAYGFTPWYWLIGLPCLLLPSGLVNGKVLEIATSVVRFTRKLKANWTEIK
jgi:glycosyltransferase involved in cell wall biosynthesis